MEFEVKRRKAGAASQFAVSCGIGLLCVLTLRGETPAEYICGSLTLDFESKVLSYGLPDSDDPNFMPYGEVVLLDHLSLGGRFYVDMTDIGRRMDRGDRRWDFWEIDFPAGLRHVFTEDELNWLPTGVEVGAGYRYEYHPPRTRIKDTQFWVADISLPDLWVVPRLAYERDVVRDDGTYLNMSLSRVVSLLEGLDLTVSLCQGWGDRKRVGGYLMEPSLVRALNRAGLMDSQFRLGFNWHIVDGLRLSVFAAYSDFLLDRHIRDASRNYIRQCDGGKRNRSWAFPYGVALTCEF